MLQIRKQFSAAHTLCEQALVLLQNALNADHPSVANSYSRMGGLLHDQGQYDEALSYLKKALAIRQKVLNPDHPDVASFYNNMTILLQNQG